MLKVEGDRIRLSLGRYFSKELGVKYLWYKLPPQVVGKKIKEVRILPRYNARYFEIEYVYEVKPEIQDLAKKKYLAIDLGLDNFATCVSTNGTAFILEGKGLKSYNRWWNKDMSKLQSVYDKQGIEMGKQLAWLLMKRKHVVNNYMSQAVNYIVKYCLTNNIGNLAIGELKDIKQQINLGKKTNQNFVCIPFGLFKQKLKAKCDYYGINYIEVNEAYTSQTCSRCGVVGKSNRKYRGLYVCKTCGMVLNADVNGAINILKKVASESVRIGSSGLVSRPIRIRQPIFVGL
jgi:IS605 OrfB family transposase